MVSVLVKRRDYGMSTELHRVHRPENWDEVVGQERAVHLLRTKLEDNSLPHSVLLHGPTGVGKTTLARLLADKLGCTLTNLTEINCADDRGINIVREVDAVMRFNPLGGRCRVWILDEVVQLPKVTQQAFLKILEEPPAHVWFFLCTTEMTNLLPTFKTRCLQVHLQSLNALQVEAIVVRVIKKLQRVDVQAAVIDKIVEKSQGSARTALVLLEAVLTEKDHRRQLDVLGVSAEEQDTKAEFLCKLLLKKSSWADIAASVKEVEDKDVEGYRRAVLKYACAVMTERPKDAVRIINWFEDNWTWSGKAGLWKAAYSVYSGQ